MKEEILFIRDATFKRKEEGYSSICEGYEIVTEKQIIKFGIDMEPCCCESPGYFMSQDDISEFIGVNLTEIHLTDTALNGKRVADEGAEHLDMGGIMFVNFETDKGTLQFTAYNAHNGYYGHTATLISEQLNVDEGL